VPALSQVGPLHEGVGKSGLEAFYRFGRVAHQETEDPLSLDHWHFGTPRPVVEVHGPSGRRITEVAEAIAPCHYPQDCPRREGATQGEHGGHLFRIRLTASPDDCQRPDAMAITRAAPHPRLRRRRDPGRGRPQVSPEAEQAKLGESLFRASNGELLIHSGFDTDPLLLRSGQASGTPESRADTW